MAQKAAHDEWMIARTRLKEAERAAGIETELEESNKRLNTYTVSAEQHLNEQRQIIFSIPDLALRRQVIHLTRECHRLWRATELERLRHLQARVKDNGERIRSDYLWGAAGFGIACVLTGNYFWDMTGALIGTVISVLVGFNHIRRADRIALADVEEAKNEIVEQEIVVRDIGSDGIFLPSEETTGQPGSTLHTL